MSSKKVDLIRVCGILMRCKFFYFWLSLSLSPGWKACNWALNWLLLLLQLLPRRKAIEILSVHTISYVPSTTFWVFTHSQNNTSTALANWPCFQQREMSKELLSKLLSLSHELTLLIKRATKAAWDFVATTPRLSLSLSPTTLLLWSSLPPICCVCKYVKHTVTLCFARFPRSSIAPSSLLWMVVGIWFQRRRLALCLQESSGQ